MKSGCDIPFHTFRIGEGSLCSAKSAAVLHEQEVPKEQGGDKRSDCTALSFVTALRRK